MRSWGVQQHFTLCGEINETRDNLFLTYEIRCTYVFFFAMALNHLILLSFIHYGPTEIVKSPLKYDGLILFFLSKGVKSNIISSSR